MCTLQSIGTNVPFSLSHVQVVMHVCTPQSVGTNVPFSLSHVQVVMHVHTPEYRYQCSL